MPGELRQSIAFSPPRRQLEVLLHHDLFTEQHPRGGRPRWPFSLPPFALPLQSFPKRGHHIEVVVQLKLTQVRTIWPSITVSSQSPSHSLLARRLYLYN